MILEIEDISVHYGKAMALSGVSLNIGESEVVSIIGANGAGKSTILRAISGLIPLTSGSIRFGKKRIDKMEIADIVKLGIVHVPEGRKLFPYLSVYNNLRLGASLRSDKNGIAEDMEDIFNWFPVLKKRIKQKAGTLSGGEQQMLAIGRGIMAKPKLLLLDEPSLGLAPIMVNGLIPIIENINKKGVAVLLVEQNIPLTLGVACRGYALQVGRVALAGTMDVFKSGTMLSKTYLGG